MSIIEEQLKVEHAFGEIRGERGVINNAGACLVTFSDESEFCYRGLDAAGCADLQLRARVKTTFYHQRFCP